MRFVTEEFRTLADHFFELTQKRATPNLRALGFTIRSGSI